MSSNSSGKNGRGFLLQVGVLKPFYLETLMLRDWGPVCIQGKRETITAVNWDWIKDVGWIGTTLVALGGLAATVWTTRRSGALQLAVQKKQLEDSRRTLVWQERRVAYAHFLKQFQEYLDKVTIQGQLNSLVNDALAEDMSSIDAGAAQAVDQRHEEVRKRMHDEYGILSMRDMWALETQLQDAANQARLIAPPSVGLGITALLRTAAKEEIEAAVQNKLVGEFNARVEQDLRILNDLMNGDLVPTV
jgi:hypothetical protein